LATKKEVSAEKMLFAKVNRNGTDSSPI